MKTKDPVYETFDGFACALYHYVTEEVTQGNLSYAAAITILESARIFYKFTSERQIEFHAQ